MLCLAPFRVAAVRRLTHSRHLVSTKINLDVSIDVIVVLAAGGIKGIPRNDPDAMYPSELVDGGYIGWQAYTSDANGRLSLNYTRGCEQRRSPCVRLNFLGAAFPGPAVRPTQSWALTDFSVPATGSYLIQCMGIGSFWIDDQYFRGNVYAPNWWFGNNAWMVWPVTLDATAVHSMRVLMTGSSFTCSFHDPVGSSCGTLVACL